jgi:hypothetical protein
VQELDSCLAQEVSHARQDGERVFVKRRFVSIVMILNILAALAANGETNPGLNRIAKQVLCSVNTIRLIVFEDRSYKCVGGRIILYIDNER